MPKEVDDCVKKRLADPDFYPDDEERESIAWAVCTKQVKGVAMSKTRFHGINIDLCDVQGKKIKLTASEDGSILMFGNAILCHAEVNGNGDQILTEEIPNLVSTLSGKPIDLDHAPLDIHGVFTEVREVVNNGLAAVSVDGLIWADRFETSARDIREGRMMLSVEADADSVSCSICSEKFFGSTEYCEHLINRRATGAVRIFHNLKGAGGALTYRPADMKAKFDTASIRMVASHQEADLMEVQRMEELKKKLKELEAQLLSAGEDGKAKDAEIAKLKADVEQLESQIKESKVTGETLTASKDGLETQVTDLTAKLKSEQDRVALLLEQARRNALKASLDDDEWKAQRETIMAMTDEQFEVMTKIAAKSKPAELNIGLSGGQLPGDDPRWEV